MPEQHMLIAHVVHHPHERRAYLASLRCGSPSGSGDCPADALRNLHRRLTRHVRTDGLSYGLARAGAPVGAIRAFLPNVLVDGPLPKSGSFLRAVPWDLRQVVLALNDREIHDRARAFDFERFETRFLHDFPLRWEPDTASEFNRFLADHDGHPAKPLAVTIPRGADYLGEHGFRQILLQRGLTPLAGWQVFLHELAHYRVANHRREFVLELARVYALWRRWFAAVTGRAEIRPEGHCRGRPLIPV